MAERPVCIYHKNCMDGRASCAIVQRLEGKIRRIGRQYGLGKPKGLLGRKVYIVDFAFDEADMREIASEAGELIWIDHHTSSVDLRERLGWGLVDEGQCAATLTWRFCFPEEPEPSILQYIKDKDQWTWCLPDSRAVNMGLEDAFEEVGFEGLLDLDPVALARRGDPLARSLRRRLERALRHGVPVTEPYGLRGVTALVINGNQDLSEIGEAVYLPESEGGRGLDLAIMFFLRADGRWVHTLRSRRVDCEAIAASRGGGGHRNAASYVGDVPFPYSDDCLDWPSGARNG